MELLTEGISHLEDLDIKTFIDAVRRIGTMQASEKLDGMNLWFGLDEKGELYTSRAGKKKGAERMYSPDDYPYFTANNGMRAAHAALEKKERDIKAILSPNDTIEIEVLYGRQPNAISYGLDGKNFIAFLRGVEGTNDLKADQLTGALENQEVSAKVIVVDTPDGVNLDRNAMTQTFRFVGVQKISPDLLKSVNLNKELKKLEKFLDAESGVNNLSNFELMTTSLGSIPKEERAAAKDVKERVLAAVKNQHKITIKKELLDKFVSKVKPALGASDLSGDEDIGIEGVVLKDPTTGELIKIVDKDNFTTINKFNFAVRSQIEGQVLTTDDAASLEARGGIVGQMKIRIADLLGNKNLALGRVAKKLFADNKGSTPTETLRAVSKTLHGGTDLNGVKKKILAVVAATIDELGSMLTKFKKHKDSAENTYQLKLKNGKTIGLSPEIVRRTLMAFAEAKRNLEELHENVGSTKTFDNLVSVLYSRAAKAAHADEEEEQVQESIKTEGSTLLEARNYTDPARYREAPDAWTLLNIYLATVFMTVLIYKANDTRGMRLVRDKAHYRMTKWTNEMSALNFWGLPVWKCGKPAVAKLLTKKTAAETFKITRKVPKTWVNFLHMDLSFGEDVPIDWQDHFKTLRYLLQHSTTTVNTERVNNLLENAFKFDELSHDEKVKFLPKLYFYARQFVPTSPLITRVRVIQNKVLGGEGDPTVLTTGQKLLGEDGEIVGVPAPQFAATTAQSIAPVETGIGRGRMIIRRKRNPDVKHKKFERPTKETT